jgi:predicted nucleotidyltransferase
VPSGDDLRAALAEAAKEGDPARRKIAVAAVIAEALRTIGREAVLVGGAAVEFYTQGGITTDDLDLIAEGGPDLRKVMTGLGFRKLGKDFVHEALGIYVEFPGRALGPSERSAVLRVGGRRLRILSREDLLVDRLCAFKFWRSAIDGLSAMLLLELGEIDERRLRSRADEEDVEDALEAVQAVQEEVIRRRLSRRRANELLERRMQELPRR